MNNLGLMVRLKFKRRKWHVQPAAHPCPRAMAQAAAISLKAIAGVPQELRSECCMALLGHGLADPETRAPGTPWGNGLVFAQHPVQAAALPCVPWAEPQHRAWVKDSGPCLPA